MSFRDEKAAETLQAVLDALTAPGTRLEEATRRQLEALIQTHGPRIATASAFTATGQVTALLDALWALGNRLPAAAIAALHAGQADPRAATLRGMAVVGETMLKTLREGLRKIVDFRVFADPVALSEVITREVSAHEDRLTPDELARWQALKTTAGQLATVEAADAYLYQIEALLGGYPRIHALLEGGKDYQRKAQPTTFRSAAERGAEARQYADILPSKGISPIAASSSAAVERYGNVYFPAQVLLTQPWIPLIVHIARQISQGSVVSAEPARMTVALGDLTLRLNADDFKIEEVIGGQPLAGLPIKDMRVVKVEPTRDSEPVIFFLTPQSAGKKRVSVDVYQADAQVASLAFETEVKEPGAVIEPKPITFEPLGLTCAPAGAQPKLPDLELRVTLLGDRRTLVYAVRAPAADGLKLRPAGQVTLSDEPQRYFQIIFDRLSTLARNLGAERTAEETQAAQQALADIGTNLYEDLFSPELQQEYARFRDGPPGQRSLLIISDEPWIPWELVRPEGVGGAGTPYVDPPLCETFKLSRWLAGPNAPALVLMRHGVWVAPPLGNLEAVRAESDYFAELHRRTWEITLDGPLSKVLDVESRFEAGNTELYHFSCHGSINPEDPNESRLQLDEDQFLSASQITGLKKFGLSKSRPLVFVNACHAGRVGFGLTRLGGWAQRFLTAGVSMFVGAQWEIRDELAAQFAQEFYNRLWGLGDFAGAPQALGDAFYGARMAIKAADPANPTWLAYVLYGDPQGQVLLGK